MNASNKIQFDGDSIKMTIFQDEYKEAFANLNLAWIEEYFFVEEMDRKHLNDPQTNILDRGGEIFLLVENQDVQGTCALIEHGTGVYEIAKMAVKKTARGRGYGNLLMETAISHARKKGAHEIIIVSNTMLEPAINLYKKYGFETTRLGVDPDYERGNIEMVLKLS